MAEYASHEGGNEPNHGPPIPQSINETITEILRNVVFYTITSIVAIITIGGIAFFVFILGYGFWTILTGILASQ